jgi:hypothetical protein
VKQQIQQSKEIVRLMDIEVLVEDFPSEWASPSIAIPKKNGTIIVVNDFRKLNLLLKQEMPSISHSENWRHDPFNGRVYLCFSIGLKYGNHLLSHHIRYSEMSLTVSTNKYIAYRIRIFYVFTHLITDSNVVCLTVYFFSFLSQIWMIQVYRW